MKKIIAIFLSVLFVVAMLPMQTFAETYNGTCGDSAKWSLDTDTGVLTISGSGDMYDYDYTDDVPWYSQKNSIKSVNIGNGVTSIGERAFEDCSSLKNITIPDGVTSIGWRAFEVCSSLTSITIPESVTSIGGDAFYNTAYYNNEDNWKNDVLFIGNHLIVAKESISGSYTVRTGTKTIADFAFYNCSSLTSITIPDGVTSIGGGAFEDCRSLTNITIPNSVTSIGSIAFYGCSSLTSITIPESVTSIGHWAFFDCTSLNSVIIPKSVNTIEERAFGYYHNAEYECVKVPNFTITGYAGTAAEKYAVDNGFKFVSLPKESLVYENGVWYYTVDGEKVNDTTPCFYNNKKRCC